MRQLRVITRLLWAVQLALIARLAVSGTSRAVIVATLLIAVLLALALRLTYVGRRLEP